MSVGIPQHPLVALQIQFVLGGDAVFLDEGLAPLVMILEAGLLALEVLADALGGLFVAAAFLFSVL